ncbi:MAG: DUF4316 domain-containing protein, partial [Clostridia bacterium]|nr:DUF4316 domain-containing protein [Clostridia bacterium]
MPLGDDMKKYAQADIEKLTAQIEDIDKQLAAMPEFTEQAKPIIEPATELQLEKLSEFGFDVKQDWNVAEASAVIESISKNNWSVPREIHQHGSKADILSETENYLKNVEMAVEGNYNMIDGIINNGADQQEIAGVYDDVERADDERERTEISAGTPKSISAEQAISELENNGKL